MDSSKVVNVKSIKDLKRFKLSIFDIDKFIKVNDLKEVTNPIYFAKPGVPTSDGLLSNEIFGINKEERSGIYAYIHLADEYFIHPLIYKTWCRMDKRIIECVHGTNKFSLSEEGYLVEDPEGDNGIDFLRRNFDKIRIKETASVKRSFKINFINNNKNMVFIKNYIVIPAFYRDADTSNNRKTTVSNANSLYSSLLVAVNGLKETKDYGITMSNASRGRIQEILVQIYDWFVKEPNLSKKNGTIKRAGLSKTTDYASRLVISAPELKVEKWTDLMTTMDYAAVPLDSICANFMPFMIFAVRRFFENEFGTNNIYYYYDNKGVINTLEVKDPLIEFSDERITEEIERFVKGYSNRLIPIKIPNKENKEIYMKLKARVADFKSDIKDLESQDRLGIIERDLTWCDVFYIAACEVVKNKTILVTRYPFDSYYSQFPTMVRVSCMKKTERALINGEIYPYYPKIRQEDIGKNTSNMFISTLNISNLYLKAIVGDYDGDQVTVKGLYLDESNQEQMRLINSKSHYLAVNGVNVRVTTNEGLQSLYNLTKRLGDVSTTAPKFKTKPLYQL